MIRYFAVLLILVILRSTLSGQGFFFDYPNIKEYNTNHDIPFNYRINTEEIIYILNSRDLKNGPDEDCGTYIIQRKNNGEIISKIDLSNDTLKVFVLMEIKLETRSKHFVLLSLQTIFI
jgi:hypothetical protein